MQVLVIEDEQKMADMIQRGLAEEGMAVTTAFDGETGLAAARQHPPDVIVLDVTLPGRDGLDVARTLRAEGSRTPIIMLTARDTTGEKVAGLDSGADDYLTKPFAFDELLARLRALHRRAQTDQATQLQMGDLTLDLINRRVSRLGHEEQLTGKEFGLLEYFMRNPDQVLSRETLSEKVWDEQFESLTNVIDVYINYLRNKMDRHFEPRLIQTVRGVGYMFRTPTTASRRSEAVAAREVNAS
ncbi:MAG: response regulator transcription factor [Blastocatellia bacterium]